MENRLSHRDFAEQLNKNFTLQLEGRDPIEMELVDVSELLLTSQQERFAIIFRKPGPEVLPQRIYSVANADIGITDLFLVPVKQESDAVYYEAIFNRFAKKPEVVAGVTSAEED
ncbi:MAG TPA: hypothetical protein VJT50_08705, partial [Pyrinomonadaceae bacterium]|nr:hypothetical protein [Pyrinomonadaceae bacterium]